MKVVGNSEGKVIEFILHGEENKMDQLKVYIIHVEKSTDIM